MLISTKYQIKITDGEREGEVKEGGERDKQEEEEEEAERGGGWRITGRWEVDSRPDISPG